MIQEDAKIRAGTAAVPYLRTWRESKLLTRKQLAELSGITEPAIEKLETGKRNGARFATIGKLADAIGITANELLHTQPESAQQKAPTVATSRRVRSGSPKPAQTSA